jgi:acetolactate synthase-1/2/3 large subunit
MTAPFKYLRVRDPADLLVAVNFGSIGLAMGEAIGAGVGRPDRPVVAAMGDGGFMLGGLAEFNTAVRHGVDLIVIVYNDNCYGSEHTKLRGRGADVKMSMMDWPDLAPVADALGGTGVTIREPDDMDQMQEAIVKRDRPLLFDVKLSPEVTALLRS